MIDEEFRFENRASIIDFIEAVREFLRRGELLETIKGLHSFTGEDTIKYIETELDDPAIVELGQLLSDLKLEFVNLEGPFITYELDPETHEFAFFNIVFRDGDWNKWKEIENYLMSRQNLTKGMVTVTCLQGLTE
ncbi:MAG: hypothetical protein KIS30_09960 [Thermoplasmata archaeon]|nr:hypothetical protein [Candidatus Sysuiplasma acidicola]